MALIFAERVKEATANRPATAATAFDLGGPRTGFRGFVAGIGSGNSCVATAQKVDANGSPTGAWETFVGTVTGASPDTLSRDHLIVSSSGSFIDWSAEGENSSPDVFVVFSAGLGASGFGPVNFVATNQWYAPVSAPDVWAGGFCTLNAFHAAPFFVPRPLVIDQMRCEVVGGEAAGRNARLGVYKQVGAASDPMPLVLDAGEVDASTTGIKTLTGLATFIDAGCYWAGLIGESNALQIAGNGSSGKSSPLSLAVLGFSGASAMSSANGISGFLGSIGAYPASLPATLTLSSAKSTHHPMVQIKFAEP